MAALNGHVDTARLLVEKGTDINVETNDGVRDRVCITDCVLVLLITNSDMMSTIV